MRSEVEKEKKSMTLINGLQKYPAFHESLNGRLKWSCLDVAIKILGQKLGSYLSTEYRSSKPVQKIISFF